MHLNLLSYFLVFTLSQARDPGQLEVAKAQSRIFLPNRGGFSALTDVGGVRLSLPSTTSFP